MAAEAVAPETKDALGSVVEMKDETPSVNDVVPSANGVVTSSGIMHDEFLASRERNAKIGYAVGIAALGGAATAFTIQIRRRGFKNVITGVSMPRDMLFYGGIYTLGDLSQQYLRLSKDGASEAKVDFTHAARIGLVTLTFFGPGFHKLYRAMDKRWPGTDGWTVFRKVAGDQLIGTGLGMVAFFGSLSILEKHDDYTRDIRVKYIPAWISGGIFWPTANFFNFKFVPSQYRVIYVSCAAFVWTNFLCYLRDTYGEQDATESAN